MDLMDAAMQLCQSPLLRVYSSAQHNDRALYSASGKELTVSHSTFHNLARFVKALSTARNL